MQIELMLVLGLVSILALFIEMQVHDIQKKVDYLLGRGPIPYAYR